MRLSRRQRCASPMRPRQSPGILALERIWEISDWELVEGFREKESPSSRQESNREQVLAELGLFSPYRRFDACIMLLSFAFAATHTALYRKRFQISLWGNPGISVSNLEEVDGPLSRQVENLVALTLERLDKISEFGQGGLRDDDTGIPSSVVREAISNAVAHRDYDLPGAVQVRVLDDHLEIAKPRSVPSRNVMGGLLESWDWCLVLRTLQLRSISRGYLHSKPLGGGS